MDHLSLAGARSVLVESDLKVASDALVGHQLVLELACEFAALEVVHHRAAVSHVASASAVLDAEEGSGVLFVSVDFREVVHSG